jgi:cytochrome bd-type quinol oxidase subunit 2
MINNRSKKIWAASALTLLIATPAFAQLKNAGNILKNTQKTAGGSYNVEQNDLSSLLGSVIGNFLAFLGTAFVIYMIYGGYLYMTAQGNEEQVEKSKSVIKNAVIGVVIIFLAYAIQYTVFSYLAGGSADNGGTTG